MSLIPLVQVHENTEDLMVYKSIMLQVMKKVKLLSGIIGGLKTYVPDSIMCRLYLHEADTIGDPQKFHRVENCAVIP
jgi:hypothetical protein